MVLKEFSGVLESTWSDMNQVTGVVDMANMYSITGLRKWQNPINNDKGRIHFPLIMDKILDNMYNRKAKYRIQYLWAHNLLYCSDMVKIAQTL